MKGEFGNIGDMATTFVDDKLTEQVISCILCVHHTLGPGFLEIIYRRALVIELTKRGLVAEVEKRIPIYYDGVIVGRHKLDILIEGKIIVELKTVEALCKAHYAQVRSYLKATGLQVALLVNFATPRVDFRRILSPQSPPSPHLREMQASDEAEPQRP
ncbi:MAG: GxxExxY protein [Gemmatimonadota bacterium]